MEPDPIEATLEVTTVLDEIGIPYFVGGSLATALHGVARMTMDVDIVVDVDATQIEELARALEPSFYVDEQQMREALEYRSSFNIIHRASMFKVDMFPPKGRPFDAAQFARRRKYVVTEKPAREAYFASPEDNVLAKLEWYRMGGEVSTRQWEDIVNVLTIQGERMDTKYLRKWAGQMGLHDLLSRALDESR